MIRTKRNKARCVLDFLTFFLRINLAIRESCFLFTSLRDERMMHTKKFCRGKVLDIGCGPNNIFIKHFIQNKSSVGLDCYKFEGLTDDQIVDLTRNLPFNDKTFDTVTIIGALNHIPKQERVNELTEIKRVLKDKGVLVFTQGQPVAEYLIHKLASFYDRIFKTNLDVDSERGMKPGEEYYVSYKEIKLLMAKTGFALKTRFRIKTQWLLNNVYVCEKSTKF